MDQLTFEQALGRLEEIVRKMEDGEVSPDRSLTLFEEGVALSRHCATKLGQAEQRVAKLLQDADGTLRDETYETAEILGPEMRDSGD